MILLIRPRLHLAWCPVKIFDKLPPNLEHLKISPGTGKVELDRMAIRLLTRLKSSGQSLPRSLRSIRCVSREDHERPVRQQEASMEIDLLHGMGLLTSCLSATKVTYVQHSSRAPKGKWYRTLEAAPSRNFYHADYRTAWRMTDETYCDW